MQGNRKNVAKCQILPSSKMLLNVDLNAFLEHLYSKYIWINVHNCSYKCLLTVLDAWLFFLIKKENVNQKKFIAANQSLTGPQ